MLNPESVANRRPVDQLSRNSRIGALAERVQPVVTKALAQMGHAIITDVPSGAWTVTAVLDAVELNGAPAVSGAGAALVVGLLGAKGAAITGWADWSDTNAAPRTLGMAHALVNGTGTKD